jgi:hypothetical protein
MRHLLAGAASLLLAATPVFADEPVKLTNQQLDEITAGEGFLDLYSNVQITLRDIDVTVDVDNVPVNAALAVQANAVGYALQGAEVTAIQQVNQYVVP